MDISAYLTPVNIGSAVAGLAISGTIMVWGIYNCRLIGTTLASIGARLFSQLGFFSLVILVFMVISVLESGEFFNANITHQAVFGLLGYALALGFDLVSVVCMQARLNAVRMRDERGQRLNLVGVIICAVVSAFANACGSLQGYNSLNLNHTPWLMQQIAPWLSMVFPAMVIILSMTMDHLLDHTPAKGLDVDTYRAREKKRIDVLQVRLDTERDLLRLETDLATLRHDREQASGKVTREWIWARWLRPSAPVPGPARMSNDEIIATIELTVQKVQTALEVRGEALSTLVSTMSSEVSEKMRAMDIVSGQMHSLRRQLDTLEAQTHALDADQPTRNTEAHRAQGAHAPSPAHRGHSHGHERDTEHPTTEEQGHTATLILTAVQRLGVGTSDTQIAREVGYSRKTVARWRKRLEIQGLLADAQLTERQAVEQGELPI